MAENLVAGNGDNVLLRSHDWAQTPLGAIETWSADLKTAVQNRLIELNSAQIQESILPQNGNSIVRQTAGADNFLSALSEVLRLLTDVNEIQATAARILGESLGASRVIYLEVLPGGELAPGVEQFWNDLYAQVVHTGESIRTEIRSDTLDRWFDVLVWRVGDAAMHQVAIVFTDISDRKRAEAILQQTSDELERQVRKFDAIAASVPDFIYTFDLLGRFTYISQSLLDLWQKTSIEAVGKNFFELDYPEDLAARLQNQIQQVIETRQPIKDETPYTSAVGTRAYEYILVPLFDATGAVEAVAGVTRDITDRKQAEAALRESEERFRNMADNAPVMVWVTDSTGYCTYLSQSWYDFTGQTEATGLGLGWLDVVHPEDSEGSKTIFLSASECHEAFRLEYRLRRKDGEYRWAIDAASPWFGVDGQFKGFIGSVIDISDRKKIEAALQAKNERLNLLSEVAADLLLNEDPKIFLARIFTKLSKHLNLEVYFNYLVEADQPYLHLHAYGGISEEIAQLAGVLELGQGVCGYVAQCRQPAVVENALSSDHPLALPVQSIGIRAYASHPLLVGDRVLGTLGMGTRQRDRFTPDELELMQVVVNQVAASLERSHLVSKLQTRAEALAQTNRIKDEFLAVLSHELRTPLNPILGWIRLLQTGRLDAARQKDALATIERNAKLQSQLIEDLLDISRIMQGKLTLNAVPVNLAFVISAAVETVSLAASAKNIQITLDLDSGVASIFGDAARLQQVAWNLLTNAVKFTDNGGRVSVQLRQVEAEGNTIAQIRVIDTGKGISPQFLPDVFEYFRQEDGSTTRKFGGLGLGLAIVRQIVELHGGTVKAESDGEGKGATFVVQLPTLQQASPIAVEPIQTGADLKTRLQNVQILLVDDDTDTREFEAFLLEQYGATVTAAASGSEALQLIDQFTPDLIVSDIGMAEIDGYMLIEQIRLFEASQRESHLSNQGGQIPAIALTAYAAELDQKRAMQAGFQRHLTKPLEPEQLIRTIVNLLKPEL
ncbi:MAG: PAS domain S-box protein [Leptolyngbya sp. Prado105]|nr:PAS domain S-box protein [Leptolyngbya sp. Prado105]